MASLLLIGAILIAVKYADDHKKAKQRDESQSTDAEAGTEPVMTESASASKRNILGRTYWHERRKWRRELGEAHMPVESVPLHSEAPPPYERSATLPMYRELEKGSVS
ncbi:uncharacterized protein BDW70DRAFT_162449 [Aspergillus foveolatus]|uniref:uncharacterized protein n=1 Tax=Aspergillus foveolatus TaxID=210207 RepID=UPI003CCCABC0